MEDLKNLSENPIQTVDLDPLWTKVDALGPNWNFGQSFGLGPDLAKISMLRLKKGMLRVGSCMLSVGLGP